MTETITIRTPEEMDLLGYKLVPQPTLEDKDEYVAWREKLDDWSNRVPGLKTPRNPDGSGGTPPHEHQLRHAAIAMMRQNNFLSWTMG